MVSGSITICPATPADMPEMIAVINSAFVVESFLQGTRTDHDRLSAMMNDGTFLIACDQSRQLVASVYLEKRDDRCYLGMLAVHPDHQGRGWGRIMTAAAEDYARNQGCRAMDLTVLSLREELLPFYRRLGYQQVGTDDFRPSRPLKAGMQCHCIKMSKEL